MQNFHLHSCIYTTPSAEGKCVCIFNRESLPGVAATSEHPHHWLNKEIQATDSLTCILLRCSLQRLDSRESLLESPASWGPCSFCHILQKAGTTVYALGECLLCSALLACSRRERGPVLSPVPDRAV